MNNQGVWVCWVTEDPPRMAFLDEFEAKAWCLKQKDRDYNCELIPLVTSFVLLNATEEA